jgi:hypothetical protein
LHVQQFATTWSVECIAIHNYADSVHAISEKIGYLIYPDPVVVLLGFFPFEMWWYQKVDQHEAQFVTQPRRQVANPVLEWFNGRTLLTSMRRTTVHTTMQDDTIQTITGRTGDF